MLEKQRESSTVSNNSFALEWYNRCPFRSNINSLLYQNYVRDKLNETNNLFLAFQRLISVFYNKPSTFHFDRHLGNAIRSLSKSTGLDEKVVKTYLLFECKHIFLDAGDYSDSMTLPDIDSGYREYDYSYNSFRDLSILKYFGNLESLSLIGCNFEDFHPLANLRKIRDLQIVIHLKEPQPIRNIDTVNLLKELECLNLERNNVDNLSMISNPRIKYLSLSSTNLHSLTQITNGQNLKYLNISNTKVDTLSGIESFSSLETLIVSKTNIKDYSRLKSLTNLKYIGAYDISNNPTMKDQLLKLKNHSIMLDIFDCVSYDSPTVFRPIWVGSKIPTIAKDLESSYRLRIKYLQRNNIWKP